ncbi:MAG: hypothetical protein QXI58_06860 [Candidatus Micrarchaeia archaeon]
MDNIFVLAIFLSLFLFLFLFGCVSGSEYNILKSKYQAVLAENARLKEELDSAKQEIEILNESLANMTERIKILERNETKKKTEKLSLIFAYLQAASLPIPENKIERNSYFSNLLSLAEKISPRLQSSLNSSIIAYEEMESHGSNEPEYATCEEKLEWAEKAINYTRNYFFSYLAYKNVLYSEILDAINETIK